MRSVCEPSLCVGCRGVLRVCTGVNACVCVCTSVCTRLCMYKRGWSAAWSVCDIHVYMYAYLHGSYTYMYICVHTQAGKGILVSAATDTMVRIWDTNSGREIVHLEGHDSAVAGACLSMCPCVCLRIKLSLKGCLCACSCMLACLCLAAGVCVLPQIRTHVCKIFVCARVRVCLCARARACKIVY